MRRSLYANSGEGVIPGDCSGILEKQQSAGRAALGATAAWRHDDT